MTGSLQVANFIHNFYHIIPDKQYNFSNFTITITGFIHVNWTCSLVTHIHYIIHFLNKTTTIQDNEIWKLFEVVTSATFKITREKKKGTRKAH